MQRIRSIAACAITPLLLASAALAQQPPTQAAQQTPQPTLDRIRAAGSIRLGYRADARPYSSATSRALRPDTRSTSARKWSAPCGTSSACLL
jgi:hypothetical protein